MTSASDSCQITPTDSDQRRRRHMRQTACFPGRDHHRSSETTRRRICKLGITGSSRARSTPANGLNKWAVSPEHEARVSPRSRSRSGIDG
jgi:hypothetical protein